MDHLRRMAMRSGVPRVRRLLTRILDSHETTDTPDLADTSGAVHRRHFHRPATDYAVLLLRQIQPAVAGRTRIPRAVKLCLFLHRRRLPAGADQHLHADVFGDVGDRGLWRRPRSADQRCLPRPSRRARAAYLPLPRHAGREFADVEEHAAQSYLWPVRASEPAVRPRAGRLVVAVSAGVDHHDGVVAVATLRLPDFHDVAAVDGP